MSTGTLLMDEAAIKRALKRIAHEIIESNQGIDNLAIIGIQRRGVVIANEIAGILEELEGKTIEKGILDITLYRDDLSLLSEHPVINGTDVGFVVNKKNIVLVDDVLFTGRTSHAAINALMDMGRPNKIQLAVVVDRGHRELPIRADFVGKNIPTAKSEEIHVNVPEFDGEYTVKISQRGDE